MVEQVSYINTLTPESKSPTIIGLVVDVGEIKTGNKQDGTTYKKQEVILRDNSVGNTADAEFAKIKLTLWDNECGLLGNGAIYKVKGYVKEWNGELVLQKGKFGKITPALEEDMLPTISTIPKGDAFTDSGDDMSVSPTPQKVDEFDYAIRMTKAFIKLIKDEGAEGAIVNVASVWNTAIINQPRK